MPLQIGGIGKRERVFEPHALDRGLADGLRYLKTEVEQRTVE
jgi:hypothetical protein